MNFVPYPNVDLPGKKCMNSALLCVCVCVHSSLTARLSFFFQYLNFMTLEGDSRLDYKLVVYTTHFTESTKLLNCMYKSYVHTLCD